MPGMGKHGIRRQPGHGAVYAWESKAARPEWSRERAARMRVYQTCALLPLTASQKVPSSTVTNTSPW